MPTTALITHEPTDVVDLLKGYSFLSGYYLVLFRNSNTAGKTDGHCWELCRSHQPPHLSQALPFAVFHETLEIAAICNRPTTLRSSEGLYIFAVPFSLQDQSLYCLVGAGSRDRAIDLVGVESLAKLTGKDPVVLLELLQEFPVTTKDDVHDIAERTYRIIAAHREEGEQTGPCDEVLDKLAAVVGVCSEIDKMTTSAAIMSLFLDTMHIIFDLPRLGVIFSGNAAQKLFLAGQWEPPTVVKIDIPHRIQNLFPQISTGKSFIVGGGEIAPFFPEQPLSLATCLMFWASDDDCGLLTLLDTNLLDRDVSLVELVCSRVASRLQQLLQEEQMLRAHSQSQKMLDLIGSILSIENQNELYDSMLESATGLVGAVSGSFMVMDANGEVLHIAAAKGINPHLAKSFTVKVGEGIAGTVAAGAEPLLIRDIESDSRTARANRSRFKTNSLVSLPVSYNRQVIGILNLADKENGGAFNETDLDMLTTFVGHLAGGVHRMRSQPQEGTSSYLEVDPSTGLYCQPFLLKRVHEEISRCKRQGRSLTMMRIEMTGVGKYADRTMRTVAGVLRGMLREMDVISRHGETSFCVMLPETGKREAVMVGERIRINITKAVAPTIGRENICAAIGLAAFPEDGKNSDELVTAAERALFRSPAKAIAIIPSKEMCYSGTMGRTGRPALFGNDIMLHDSRQLIPLFHNLPCKDSLPDAQPVQHPRTGLPAD